MWQGGRHLQGAGDQGITFVFPTEPVSSSGEDAQRRRKVRWARRKSVEQCQRFAAPTKDEQTSRDIGHGLVFIGRQPIPLDRRIQHRDALLHQLRCALWIGSTDCHGRPAEATRTVLRAEDGRGAGDGLFCLVDVAEGGEDRTCGKERRVRFRRVNLGRANEISGAAGKALRITGTSGTICGGRFTTEGQSDHQGYACKTVAPRRHRTCPPDCRRRFGHRVSVVENSSASRHEPGAIIKRFPGAAIPARS